MSLTITLQRHAEDWAEGLDGAQSLGRFDPRALLVEHPLHTERGRYVAPEAYGQRLLAALGGPALLEQRGAPTCGDVQAALGVCAEEARALLRWLVDEGLAAVEGQKQGRGTYSGNEG